MSVKCHIFPSTLLLIKKSKGNPAKIRDDTLGKVSAGARSRDINTPWTLLQLYD